MLGGSTNKIIKWPEFVPFLGPFFCPSFPCALSNLSYKCWVSAVSSKRKHLVSNSEDRRFNPFTQKPFLTYISLVRAPEDGTQRWLERGIPIQPGLALTQSCEQKQTLLHT